MAIGQSSPYASPLSYSAPMTSTPTTASILGAMQPKAPTSETSSPFRDMNQILGSFQRQQSQPLEFLDTPSYQQYQRTGPINLLDLVSGNYLQQVLQAEQMPTVTLLDYIKLLGGL